MNWPSIEGHIGFVSAVISIAIVTPAIVLWLQRHNNWLDRIVIKIFKIGDEEEKISSVWNTVLDELNTLAPSEAVLYSLHFDAMPKITLTSSSYIPWMSSSDVLNCRKHHEVIKTHAFVVGDTYKRSVNQVIPYVQSDYVMVEAARENGIKPPILSANAIVFCPATREILLHFRANTRTYPNAVHFLGGNYEPALATELFDDADAESPLRRAALREIKEESKLELPNPSKALVILGEELTTGFIQCTYAGIAIGTSMKRKTGNSPEGGVAWVSFSELIAFSKTGIIKGKRLGIVPSGALTIMMWLKLGAPNQSLKKPCNKDAIATYNELLPNIISRFAPF